MFDTRSSLEARRIKIQRTIALDLKAIAEMEARLKTRRDTVRALQADLERVEKQIGRKG